MEIGEIERKSSFLISGNLPRLEKRGGGGSDTGEGYPLIPGYKDTLISVNFAFIDHKRGMRCSISNSSDEHRIVCVELWGDGNRSGEVCHAEHVHPYVIG